jgi:hypothetical protein
VAVVVDVAPAARAVALRRLAALKQAVAAAIGL